MWRKFYYGMIFCLNVLTNYSLAQSSNFCTMSFTPSNRFSIEASQYIGRAHKNIQLEEIFGGSIQNQGPSVTRTGFERAIDQQNVLKWSMERKECSGLMISSLSPNLIYSEYQQRDFAIETIQLLKSLCSPEGKKWAEKIKVLYLQGNLLDKKLGINSNISFLSHLSSFKLVSLFFPSLQYSKNFLPSDQVAGPLDEGLKFLQENSVMEQGLQEFAAINKKEDVDCQTNSTLSMRPKVTGNSVKIKKRDALCRLLDSNWPRTNPTRDDWLEDPDLMLSFWDGLVESIHKDLVMYKDSSKRPRLIADLRRNTMFRRIIEDELSKKGNNIFEYAKLLDIYRQVYGNVTGSNYDDHRWELFDQAIVLLRSDSTYNQFNDGFSDKIFENKRKMDILELLNTHGHINYALLDQILHGGSFPTSSKKAVYNLPNLSGLTIEQRGLIFNDYLNNERYDRISFNALNTALKWQVKLVGPENDLTEYFRKKIISPSYSDLSLIFSFFNTYQHELDVPQVLTQMAQDISEINDSKERENSLILLIDWLLQNEKHFSPLNDFIQKIALIKLSPTKLVEVSQKLFKLIRNESEFVQFEDLIIPLLEQQTLISGRLDDIQTSIDFISSSRWPGNKTNAFLNLALSKIHQLSTSTIDNISNIITNNNLTSANRQQIFFLYLKKNPAPKWSIEAKSFLEFSKNFVIDTPRQAQSLNIFFTSQAAPAELKLDLFLQLINSKQGELANFVPYLDALLAQNAYISQERVYKHLARSIFTNLANAQGADLPALLQMSQMILQKAPSFYPLADSLRLLTEWRDYDYLPTDFFKQITSSVASANSFFKTLEQVLDSPNLHNVALTNMLDFIISAASKIPVSFKQQYLELLEKFLNKYKSKLELDKSKGFYLTFSLGHLFDAFSYHKMKNLDGDLIRHLISKSETSEIVVDLLMGEMGKGHAQYKRANCEVINSLVHNGDEIPIARRKQFVQKYKDCINIWK